MRLGRGLAVIVWLVPVYALDFISLFFGGSWNPPELNLLLAFVLAWCNDE